MEIIVGLGTNGPISDTDFDTMMSIASEMPRRVVFVNGCVYGPAVAGPQQCRALVSGATRYRNAVVADWATLAAQNPQWFGADRTTWPSTNGTPSRWLRWLRGPFRPG